MGINTPSPQCSCTGGEIAEIGSGTVSATTYSWCKTGKLPSSVPTEATAQPTAQPAAQPTAQLTSQAPAPGPTQSCSVQAEVGERGMILGHECICNIGPTPTATIINKEYTCPTKPPSKKRGFGELLRVELARPARYCGSSKILTPHEAAVADSRLVETLFCARLIGV